MAVVAVEVVAAELEIGAEVAVVAVELARVVAELTVVVEMEVVAALVAAELVGARWRPSPSWSSPRLASSWCSASSSPSRAPRRNGAALVAVGAGRRALVVVAELVAVELEAVAFELVLAQVGVELVSRALVASRARRCGASPREGAARKASS